MTIHAITYCDNAATFDRSRLPSVFVSTDQGGFGIEAPPAMPADDANAVMALFAAAPAMLSALRLVHDAYKAESPFDRIIARERMLEAATAAIAAAEGRSNG